MDLRDTPQEAAFRAEVRAFIEENLPGGSRSRGARRFEDADRDWSRRLGEAGYAGLTWPKEFGGAGAPYSHQAIFLEELARAEAPSHLGVIGLGMAGPTIIAWGTSEQQERFLPPMLRGDDVWCQLFSEPGAGSDLAGLRTRAELDGDEWTINGQKVWTSGAHYSDWGLLLARSDPDAPKHKGITAFLLDMHTPGIDVRPLRQITGASHFNEVFLTDVRVSDAMRLGPRGGGWRAANTMLSNERAMIGGGGRVGFRDLVALATRCGANGDPTMRQELVRSYTRTQLIKWLGMRARSRTDQGLGPEASVLKLAASRRLEYDGNLVMELQGAQSMLYDDDAIQHGYWQQQFLGQWSSRIGGGTEQVQRNVIGERVLGLPSEPRPDKDTPFRELPS